MKPQPRRRKQRPHPGWVFPILSLGLLTLPLLARAETVVVLLKNGDRLTGTVMSQDNSHLVLETVLGRLTVPLEQIQSKEVKPSQPPAAAPQAVPQPPSPPKPTAESVVQTLRSLSDQYQAGKITAAEYHQKRAELLETGPATGMAQPQPAAPPPVAEKPAPAPAPAPAPPGGVAKAKIKSQWTGELRIGLDQGWGTKDRQLLTGSAKLTQAWQRFRNIADYRVAYGKTDGDLTANRMDGTLKSDWQIKSRYYLYNLGGAGYDEIRKIDLKYEEGPGAGMELLKLKNLGLSAEVGVNYYVELHDELKTRENFYYRPAETFTWKLTPRLQLDEKFEWFPRFEEPQHYRIRFESNLQYLLGSKLSLVLTVLDQYDTDPAPGVEPNDLQILSSLGVKF